MGSGAWDEMVGKRFLRQTPSPSLLLSANRQVAKPQPPYVWGIEKGDGEDRLVVWWLLPPWLSFGKRGGLVKGEGGGMFEAHSSSEKTCHGLSFCDWFPPLQVPRPAPEQVRAHSPAPALVCAALPNTGAMGRG
jgi:hypothetical protein